MRYLGSGNRSLARLPSPSDDAGLSSHTDRGGLRVPHLVGVGSLGDDSCSEAVIHYPVRGAEAVSILPLSLAVRPWRGERPPLASVERLEVDDLASRRKRLPDHLAAER